jgi:hypothetical protein
LLALIIGFSFSIAIGRYEQRRDYEEAEAKAIGTEYVRADFLASTDAAKVRVLLRTTSLSAFCSIRAAVLAAFGKSIGILLNCKPICGPRSKFPRLLNLRR